MVEGDGTNKRELFLFVSTETQTYSNGGDGRRDIMSVELNKISSREKLEPLW